MNLNKAKAVPTIYKWTKFRSKLEAKWACFFDVCGVDWEYEPTTFDLGDGIRYEPDFLFHKVDGMREEVWVEIKEFMTGEDAEKIKRFREAGNTIVVFGRFPISNNIEEIDRNMEFISQAEVKGIKFFSFDVINETGLDNTAMHIGVDKNDNFRFFYKFEIEQGFRDDQKTLQAYHRANLENFIVKNEVRLGIRFSGENKEDIEELATELEKIFETDKKLYGKYFIVSNGESLKNDFHREGKPDDYIKYMSIVKLEAKGV